ncbi:MAG: lysozyme inhibitor LprI family protein [Elusimicrobiota bacterium]
MKYLASKKLFFFVLAAHFLNATFLMAKSPCDDPQSTIEVNRCWSEKVIAAEKELDYYLKTSMDQLKKNVDKTHVNALTKSQKSWEVFMKSECDAIYQYWKEGSIRTAMEGECTVIHTKRRTHDLWRNYLTYMDSTPPVLPEPELYREEK